LPEHWQACQPAQEVHQNSIILQKPPELEYILCDRDGTEQRGCKSPV